MSVLTWIVISGLAMSALAGNFIYIALADLLPETKRAAVTSGAARNAAESSRTSRNRARLHRPTDASQQVTRYKTLVA